MYQLFAQILFAVHLIVERHHHRAEIVFLEKRLDRLCRQKLLAHHSADTLLQAMTIVHDQIRLKRHAERFCKDRTHREPVRQTADHARKRC